MSFTAKIPEVIDESPKGDFLYLMGDWNAIISCVATSGIEGNFGLGEKWKRPEAGKFFAANDLITLP